MFRCFRTVSALILSLWAGAAEAAWDGAIFDLGHSALGAWRLTGEFGPEAWKPGAAVNVRVTLSLSRELVANLAAKGMDTGNVVMLVTAERVFDADGIERFAVDERSSTLLTPTGLAIEGGARGAVTQRFGGKFKTPLDLLQEAPLVPGPRGAATASFDFQARLPDDLPPGIYRLRFDHGVEGRDRRLHGLNGEGFAQRTFLRPPNDSESRSRPIRADGPRPDGRHVDAAAIRPRLPMVLLDAYNSNGYRGVVANEDRGRFALSPRNIIPDEVILPLHPEGDQKTVLAYSLEPRLPADTVIDRASIPWAGGEFAITVDGPDGRSVDLGRAPILDVGYAGRPSTKNPAFTQWRPWGWGAYTVHVKATLRDDWGGVYEGGGTYSFWIANRMTIATAIFQGQPYTVGDRLGRDLALNPPLPAEVRVEETLYPGSDPKAARTVVGEGRATPGGLFGAEQGARSLPLDRPGEYAQRIFARAVDADGRLWVAALRHAGVVSPPDTPIVAHGKMLRFKEGGREVIAPRGHSAFEGTDRGTEAERQLDHIDFPQNAGDVLLIASDGEGANKIVPTLTWADKAHPEPYDARLQGIGETDVRIETAGGWAPHLFPEYITDLRYYYAGAPRPGFMGRFIVAEDGVRAPYWPTSLNDFGGQIGATANGDAPGTIYRLLGGVALRDRGIAPRYAGYMASAVILPGGTRDNRVVAPGSEDLTGPFGARARFFLALNARPGSVYDQGSTFAPAVQIDPFVPANVDFTLTWPDGRTASARGVGDAGGLFVGRERWSLDQAGLYRFKLTADWEGREGVVPGMPTSGGEFYVVEKTWPVGARGLSFDLPPSSRFDPAKPLRVVGHSTAAAVRVAAIMPGAVLEEATLPVKDGSFEYVFDPAAIAAKTRTYTAANHRTGKPELGDVVHLTFFSEETRPAVFHSFQRLILRGNVVNYAR